jgi:hypothetical protein
MAFFFNDADQKDDADPTPMMLRSIRTTEAQATRRRLQMEVWTGS